MTFHNPFKAMIIQYALQYYYGLHDTKENKNFVMYKLHMHITYSTKFLHTSVYFMQNISYDCNVIFQYVKGRQYVYVHYAKSKLGLVKIVDTFSRLRTFWEKYINNYVLGQANKDIRHFQLNPRDFQGKLFEIGSKLYTLLSF